MRSARAKRHQGVLVDRHIPSHNPSRVLSASPTTHFSPHSISGESRTRSPLRITGMVAASVASLPELCPAPSGRVTSLAKIAEAQEGRDNIKAAARWLPTTSSNVSGMNSDRRATRDQLRPPKRSSSSRGIRLGANCRFGSARHDATPASNKAGKIWAGGCREEDALLTLMWRILQSEP